MENNGITLDPESNELDVTLYHQVIDAKRMFPGVEIKIAAPSGSLFPVNTGEWLITYFLEYV